MGVAQFWQARIVQFAPSGVTSTGLIKDILIVTKNHGELSFCFPVFTIDAVMWKFSFQIC